MTLEDIKKVTVPVQRRWGERMPLMAAEEAGEYIQAISKLERKRYWKKGETPRVNGGAMDSSINQLVEEMGDVLIGMGALANRYNIGADEIAYAIARKLSEERTV